MELHAPTHRLLPLLRTPLYNIDKRYDRSKHLSYGGSGDSGNQTTPFSRSCISQIKATIGKSVGPSIGLLVFTSVGLFVRLSIRPEPASQ